MYKYFSQSLSPEPEKGGVKDIIKKCFGYSLLLVVGTMPFSIKVNSASIIILAIVWICEGQLDVKWKRFLQNPLIWAFILFYLAFLIGILYTDNIEVGRYNLEKKISLIILPLILGTSISYDHEMKKWVLFFFVVICLLASLICLGNGLYHFIILNDTTYLFYMGLSSVIDFHPPYFGMYLSLSVIICFYYLKNNWIKFSLLQRLGGAMLVIYFVIIVLLLSARTSGLFLVLFFSVGIYFLLIRRRKIKEGVIAVTLFLAVVFFTIRQSSYLSDRITTLFTSDISAINGGKETGLSLRIVKWKCSIEGIKENPFLGTGTGDAIDYLVSCYEKLDFWGMLPQYRFNSHNQYLETGLTLGLVGLGLFLICLILPAILAMKRRDFLFLSFMGLFCFCCLTESLLERQWGIVFFTFFTSLFYNDALTASFKSG